MVLVLLARTLYLKGEGVNVPELSHQSFRGEPNKENHTLLRRDVFDEVE
jgi:hypothetical protein